MITLVFIEKLSLSTFMMFAYFFIGQSSHHQHKGYFLTTIFNFCHYRREISMRRPLRRLSPCVTSLRSSMPTHSLRRAWSAPKWRRPLTLAPRKKTTLTLSWGWPAWRIWWTGGPCCWTGQFIYPLTLVPLGIVIWISDAFDNNSGIKNDFTKYLMESCWYCPD